MLQLDVESCRYLQAIHHKVHFLIQSSLQACQDSSKGPIQPQALLALCCSLQILEVRLGAPPSQPVLPVQWDKTVTLHKAGDLQQSVAWSGAQSASTSRGSSAKSHAIRTQSLPSFVCSTKSCISCILLVLPNSVMSLMPETPPPPPPPPVCLSFLS